MHQFTSIMFSLLVITGLQVSVQTGEKRSEGNLDRPYKSELTVTNGGGWGFWGEVDMCPDGTYAAGFSLKVEAPVGQADDTALNGIRLYCVGSGNLTDSYPSYCKVQSDVARFRCSNGVSQLGNGTDWGDWGDWGDWSDTCEGTGICGLRTLVELPQGNGDDTALNDVIMYCCD
ncbi:vitelline membrane outer layer protein 1 homolog isoform X2 [Carassius gibelio]|uniref:vitelline membrane outer layer protein 1 homolog isoform X2 n=1 Tax=Carassius gibelio TaxID=101364 RepID=UPI002279023E|nr:vitelline membrane outer layer protein 1 homolog isoform X2 [Carassius gibelio]